MSFIGRQDEPDGLDAARDAMNDSLEGQENRVLTREDIRLQDYLIASYPLIFIKSEEDQRSVRLVQEAARVKSSICPTLKYGEWKATTGLCFANQGEYRIPANANPVERDLVQALGHVGKSTEPMCVVFHNIRHFMDNFMVIQQLKDAAFNARYVSSHIILIGPTMNIPPELKSMLTVYDLPLPSKDMFKEEFGHLLNAYSDELTRIPNDSDVDLAAALAVGMTSLAGENAISLSMSKNSRLDHDIIRVEKEQAVKRGDVLEFIRADRGLDSLGGFDLFKDWMTKRQTAFTKDAIDYGLEFPKGVLLIGIPGCGKSLSAKVCANYLNLPLLKLDMGRVFKGIVGSSEATVEEALKIAEAVSPVVLWIEEIEKSMSGVSGSDRTDGGTTARVMSHVLTWMQEKTKPVFVFATANQVESLPAEMLRKGRFSEIFGVQEPTLEELLDIWRIQIARKRPNRIDEFDIEALAQAAAGYTGAEIEGIVNEVMFDCFADGRREMQTEDLMAGLQKIVPQSVTSAERMKSIRTWMDGRVRYVSSKYAPQSTPATRNDSIRKLGKTQGTKV